MSPYALLVVQYIMILRRARGLATISARKRELRFSTFDGVLSQMAKKQSPSTSAPSTEGEARSSVTKDLRKSQDQWELLVGDLEGQSRHISNNDLSPDLPEVNADEISKDVSDAIHSLLSAQSVWPDDRDPHSASLEDESLTPAQRFYLENKELLLSRASEYSVTRAMNEFDRATQNIQDEWAFYRDPVVRPPRGHLWSSADSSTPSHTEEEENTYEFEAGGSFPEIEHIIHLLEREKVSNIISLDLELCGRRDIGEWALIGTVESATQGERVGNLARKSVNKLGLSNVKCFINAIPGQEWVVTRLGPVVLHLMTAADRQNYRLEDMYTSRDLASEEFINPSPTQVDTTNMNQIVSG